jgi:hypothetical protein
MGYLLTTTSGGESLTTTRRTAHGWAEVEQLLTQPSDVARQHTLDRNGDVIAHLVIEGDRAHLSVWEGDTCHYLCGDGTEEPMDLGWNAYPGWSISDRSAAIAAIHEFVVNGRLMPSARWRSELVEL